MLSDFTIAYTHEPCIVEKNEIVVKVNKAFLELSGFSQYELLNRPLISVWNELLRINANPYSIDKPQEAFLFTKQLAVRNVIIHKQTDTSSHQVNYIIRNNLSSRLNVELPYIDYLYSNSNSGVAMYSVPDLILIKSNQVYLDFLEAPYDNSFISIGKPKESITTSYKGSKFEEMFNDVIRTGQVLVVREEPFHGFARGITYWDISLVPIYEAGCMKYMIEVSREVTAAAKNRQLLAEQNKIILQQKEQLEAIIENMSDSLYIFDKTGKYTLFNKAAREMFFPSYEYMNKVGDGHYQSENFDYEGNKIPLENTPSYRVMNGETFSSMKMQVRYPDKTLYLEVSGTPLYDSEGNFSMGILCSRDVTDLTLNASLINRQNEKLLKAEIENREALEASIILKDEFIYLISHEMRTPGAIVSSALQAIELMYKNELTPNVSKHLNTIKQNTNRQLRLVNNLLDITRISSGNIKLNRSAFDIVYLTKAIVNSIEIYAKQKGLGLSFSSDISKKETFLDEEKYERILLNLLANAVKFTPKGKQINISVITKKQKSRNTIFIDVSDEGIGIPKDKQCMIFERFGQVDSSLSRQAEGTGLGLTLVKLLVEAMEGEITLKSEVGKGSTFTVMLPIVKSIAVKEATACSESTNQFLSKDRRIVQAASIEFSDIYFD